jgi:hypothetical protein
MQRHWLTRPESIRKLWTLFIAVLAATVGAELFIEHEAHFGIEVSFAFNAWFGFAACALLIVVAKLIGFVLKRPDSYYGQRHE